MKAITLIEKRETCSACGACMIACPVNAISFQEDDTGCQYPVIDSQTCIQCGRCVAVCEYRTSSAGKSPVCAYAAIGTQEDLVRQSASGGVFAMLAVSCLESGCKIAGAVMDFTDGQADVYHILTDQRSDLGRIQGSKYVQSQAWRCYEAVQRALKDGQQVLFSGTPCQVAAIKKLTGDPPNLTTVDLICHGVPPIQMLNDYLDILGKRFGGKVRKFSFREKSCDKNFCARFDVTGKKNSLWLRSHYLSFYKYFLEGKIYRENCYSCPYASTNRVADITIGDYWGIEQFHGADIASGRIPDRKDWSCVLVNTEKGNALLEKHGKYLFLHPTQVASVAKNNQQLNSPSQKKEEGDRICEMYAKGGYKAVEADFVRSSGGALRYHWRVCKNLFHNQKMQNASKESKV